MSVTKKLFWATLALLLLVPVAGYAKKKRKEKAMLTTEQRKKTIDWLNENGWWRLSDVRWTQSDDRMESYIYSLSGQGLDAIAVTREMLIEQQKRVDNVLALRHDLLLRVPKGQEASTLAQHFKDVEGANKTFEHAAAVKSRSERLIRLMDAEMASRKPRKAPGGHLLSLEYSTHNGFAGSSDEMKLTRNPDGTGTLLVTQKRMRMERDLDGEEGKSYVVSDSVLLSVENMIRENHTYEMGSHYDSDYEIMDASSWSLFVKFEDGSFSSGGYAAWPGDKYKLSEILSLISKAANGDTQEK